MYLNLIKMAFEGKCKAYGWEDGEGNWREFLKQVESGWRQAPNYDFGYAFVEKISEALLSPLKGEGAEKLACEVV